MGLSHWVGWCLTVTTLIAVLEASEGDADPVYRNCEALFTTCFQQCNFTSSGDCLDGGQYLQESLYLQWKQWDCHSDCRYHCMLSREEERQRLGHKPTKYHGKWPFLRIYGIQESVSIAFSALNLTMHFHGWISFFILIYYKLALEDNRKAFYEFTGLWHIYGMLAMNSWFWSAVFHSRDVDLTEKLDYSSAVALLGYSLILAILRVFNVKIEAARVMISAPLIAFTTTHILYLNSTHSIMV
ncbi:hypothetical protein Droror1_Dr00003849 [Drosera rotundifolia]